VKYKQKTTDQNHPKALLEIHREEFFGPGCKFIDEIEE